LLIIFPNIANSLTSSSYLITNAAVSSFDYETASKYFTNQDNSNLDIIEQDNKIISFINSNKLEEANSTAKHLITSENNNEDAWLVLLVYAKLNNDLKTFNKFEVLKNKKYFTIIDYVFYKNVQLKKSNEEIAKRLYNLVQEIDLSSLNYPINIDYALFYLNLSLSLKPVFNEVLFFQAQIYQELKHYFKAEDIYNKIYTLSKKKIL